MLDRDGPISLPSSEISAARAGSREALGRALDRNRKFLLSVAQRSLGSALQGKGGASDLVQETFLDAQRFLHRFDGATEEQLRSWLRNLLLHRASKLGRAYRNTRKRMISRELHFDSERQNAPHASQIAAATATPSAQIMGGEQLERLYEAIARLPEDYREVLLLRYREGMPFDEIGRRLQRSPDAARMLWARGVERLKLELQSDSAA